MTVSVVIADANILFSRTLRDYVLYGDEAGGFEVPWSPAILAEMSRNLRAKRESSQARTDRLEELVNAFRDDALVEVHARDEAAVESVDMDPKDRHILAATLSAGADILLTENVLERIVGTDVVDLLRAVLKG
ncbi:PIN domain-containing protein [Xylanimonas protaetiae]|uniref:PIN domain-containing protein n=1 Tax=Xylanimonas protaetiae TaxID=2509457 RepID=A0A4P6F9K2_9MICO|nr:PIN domain-containing protein [Xylanimonas protaetiae]QAY71603.1 PIN domain-containing protein [Xylanimonas protaetiae]